MLMFEFEPPNTRTLFCFPPETYHYIRCATGEVVSYGHPGVTAVDRAFAGGVYSPNQARIYLVYVKNFDVYLFYCRRSMRHSPLCTTPARREVYSV